MKKMSMIIGRVKVKVTDLKLIQILSQKMKKIMKTQNLKIRKKRKHGVIACQGLRFFPSSGSS